MPQRTAVGDGDHRSYFSVEDAVEYLDPDRTLDELPASRAELAEVLAGGQAPAGTDADSRPNLFFVFDSEDQDTADRTQELFSPQAECDYNVGGFIGLDVRGGYPPGLTGAFQAAGDGGSMRPDWVYVHWYDDDLTYDEATALLDESVLGWIFSRWSWSTDGFGYSGSKIAVTLGPEPTAPWNQTVIDHPFVHPAAVGEDLVDAVCDTFDSMETL